MRTRTIPALLALAVILPAGAALSDEEKVEKKRVVRVVTSPDFEFEANEDFVFVGEGDHNVHLGAFGFHRGGFIGVQLVDLTPELRAHFGAPEDVGVMISAVSDGGPAAEAGIAVGDIITAVDSEEVESGSDLARLIRHGSEGDLVNLEVWRDGRVMTLSATLAERERPQVDVGKFLWKSGEGEDLKKLDILLDELPESVIRIDPDRMNRALGDLTAHFQSPEWQAKIKAMTMDRDLMEDRIHELESRLRELEEKLSKLE